MGIKKYIADRDNTITNAYGVDLRTRATGSNMGASDILEVFSIYGLQHTSSAELSRVLVRFPVSTVSSDRTVGTIPASGSVKFYLRMFNARHSEQLPTNYTVNVLAVSQSWQEGYGLDMESYKDKTKDGIEGSNWINASSNNVKKATLADAIDITGHENGDKFTMTVPTVAGGDGVAYTFLFDSTTNVNSDTGANTFGISRQIVADDGALRDALIDAINGTANSAVKYGNADTGAGSTLTAGTIGLTAKAGSSAYNVTLTMDTAGSAGNVENVLAASTGFENALLLESSFTGGDGPWAKVGGCYHDAAYTAGQTMPNYTYTFAGGDEDLELDVTAAVEEWIAGTQTNNGFGVFLTSSFEAFTTASDSNVLHNPAGAKKSYYTKRFFSRSSEFFFKKPCLEARWDSRTMDDRGEFHYSSSLAPPEDNLNTLYLYNYVRGSLKDIPGLKGGLLHISIYSGSAENTEPSGSKLSLSLGGGVLTAGDTNVTGGYVSTGIYSASFAFTGSTSLKTIYDVWHTSSAAGAITEFVTRSITPKSFDASSWNQYPEYTTKITNLKPSYNKDEKARFRAFVRERNRTPTIYNVAKSSAPVTIIPSASFEIIRMVDERTVIQNSTGSSDYHTFLSYDNSGSYFDLDMTMLEPGYMYGIKLAFYSSDGWREQEEVHKFRVKNN